jgi:hypothetical protein
MDGASSTEAQRLFEPAKLLATLTKRAGKKAPGKGPPSYRRKLVTDRIGKAAYRGVA